MSGDRAERVHDAPLLARPAGGWKALLLRVKDEVGQDHVSLLAAGVAFYAFLAVFPGLIAAVTVYGLVADPAQVEQQVQWFSRNLPPQASELLSEQLRELSSGPRDALSVGLAVSLAAALFAASTGMLNLIKAVNLAYDAEETRGFLRLRAVALLTTLAAVVFVVVAVGLVAVLPVVLEAVGITSGQRVVVQVARWVGLLASVVLALGVLYRYAPSSPVRGRSAWVGPGSVLATVLWLLGSAGFSLYVTTVGRYGRTYGALAGVVVLLLWLLLTAYVVLLGAETNNEWQRRTGRRAAGDADRAPPAAPP